MPNHLVNETSPYLLQHAHNPVDWYPWSPEALNLARQANKPIFLSIGYSACHWCHVMERESFEDQAIAQILNREFISIKVDREERPDIDHIYMSAVVAMTGQGGWPLNVFLTPDLRPFYGGTYFPPVSRYRLPSFQSVLEAIALAWKTDQEKLLQSSQRITQYLVSNLANSNPSTATFPLDIPKVLSQVEKTYDWDSGGWGSAPKFPQPIALDWLLMHSDQHPGALKIAVHALESMQRGGFFDLLGGGFHRYSTDVRWKTPHYEKMLPDNAQLALVYLHAYMLTGNIQFKVTCEQTLDFILREMTNSDGGFFSSLDADSEGEEGRYYTWSLEEIAGFFPESSSLEQFLALHQISADVSPDERFSLARSEQARTDDPELKDALQKMDAVLRDKRATRARPAADDKVVVSMNALAMQAFAEAGRFLDRSDYLNVAQKNAFFIVDHLYQDQRLLRIYRNGLASQPALLEDYAALCLSLTSLYQADFNMTWLITALSLAETMLTLFFDPERNIFVDIPQNREDVLLIPITWEDNATPSAMAQAVRALFLLTAYDDRPEWLKIAENLTNSSLERAIASPLGYASWLQNAFYLQNPIEQIAILYPPGDLNHLNFVRSVNARYQPSRITAADVFPPPDIAPALLRERPLVDNKATFFLCTNFACQKPLTHPDDVEALLNP